VSVHNLQAIYCIPEKCTVTRGAFHFKFTSTVLAEFTNFTLDVTSTTTSSNGTILQ